MSHDDFDPTLPASEREQLEELAARLVAERPVPRASFRGELRRLVVAPRPELRGLRVRVAAHVGTGFALLGVAALGVNGVGPLA